MLGVEEEEEGQGMEGVQQQQQQQQQQENKDADEPLKVEFDPEILSKIAQADGKRESSIGKGKDWDINPFPGSKGTTIRERTNERTF